MLIEFSVGNFRSFKDRVTLSFVAANTSARDPKTNKNNTIIVNDKLTLLTSLAVYGANASGKSNIVMALNFMRRLVLSSAKESQSGEPLAVEPFRLSTETENQPSFFEIVFLLNDTQYRYGFEVNRNRVVSEWLFSVPSLKEATLFVREENKIEPSARFFREGKGLDEKTRPNALFLSVVSQFNGEISQSILKWFRRMGVVSGLDDMLYRAFTIRQVIEGKHKNEIIQLVKNLDLGISDIEGIKLDKTQVALPPNMPEELRAVLVNNLGDQDWLTVQTKHPKLDAKGLQVDLVLFDMDQNESHGTQKAFYLAGPIIDALSQGKVLIIDEIEARLHPLLTRELIGLFNSLETNPQRAQLIFTTHDTNLLSNKMFRRDQIWFLEKDNFNASHLYSLAEIKIESGKVRNDAAFEDDYLKGRYGAIPFLGGIKKIVLEGEKNDEEN
ncbi:MAG: abortive infection protein [Anaerolineae bacterium CG03_land_8_20_14_0_80_58_20]|nr:MAG: abortive infection protein [Anaerolineae bacterium CG1_02_58_13]PIV26425.1 MAG: abortive infection protein [Anaerolineae bacterium CG03_land_8_20_14_0_80_58_20]